MTVPDPVDVRLLSLLAEVGRVAVHDLAARAGMDVREVAARLAALAATGLPLVVGAECDQAALRVALARQASGGYAGRAGQASYTGYHGHQVGPQIGQSPTQSGPTPVGPTVQAGPASGPVPINHPSGPVPMGPPSGPVPMGPPSGPVPMGPPSGPVSTGPPSGPVPVGPPSGPVTVGAPAGFGPSGVQRSGVDPVGTWGPPQTSAWARGDQGATNSNSTTVRTVPAGRRDPDRRTGVVGDVLYGEGLSGEQVSIQLVEVVDPADFLFTAAGYRLQPGERSVVVHTELRNRGAVPFSSLPDQFLVLVDVDGATVSKAPVSLSSRPPHRIGVQPGETAGGHTVYVLPETTELAAVRWRARPDDDSGTLTWRLE